MASAKGTLTPVSLDAHCYRLSTRGRGFVHVVKNGKQPVGSLSHYMYDILMLCGTGAWFEQLRQFMPPRSLEDSLRSLLALDLIEVVEPSQAPPRQALPVRRAGKQRSQMAILRGTPTSAFVVTQ